jgi:hypothetical protein
MMLKNFSATQELELAKYFKQAANDIMVSQIWEP